MKKKLKSSIESPVRQTPICLVDMNRVDMVESVGFFLDLLHKKSAHVTGGWNPAEQYEIRIPLGGSDLSDYDFLVFSLYADRAKGFSFCVQLDLEENVGFQVPLTVLRNGWNDFRLPLDFFSRFGGAIERIAVQSIRIFAIGEHKKNPILYFDSFFIYRKEAPALCQTLPELRRAALFALGGRFAVVRNKRIPIHSDASDVTPFEKDGTVYLPMAPVAAVMAHQTAADPKTGELTFKYRRHAYVFFDSRTLCTEDGKPMQLPEVPIQKDGVLFLPADFVASFFGFSRVSVFRCGAVLLSGSRGSFLPGRDEAVVADLLPDLCMTRFSAERMTEDLHRLFPQGSRGRLFLSFDGWNALKKEIKEDEDRTNLKKMLKRKYADDEISNDGAMAAATLYRLTGDKKFSYRARNIATTLAENCAGTISDGVLFGNTLLAVSFVYDVCRHGWSEAEKAGLERAILRGGIRPGIASLEGHGTMWEWGSDDALAADMGLLASALAFADVYPESAKKIFRRVLNHAEISISRSSSEENARMALLMGLMLKTALGSDCGILTLAKNPKNDLLHSSKPDSPHPFDLIF